MDIENGAGRVMNTVRAGSTHWWQECEYVRLARAAALIGCDADQLLHLGAIGEATLLAPVMAKGEYEWPVDDAGQESWREPFRATFDASDRVILHRRDVAKIEATGWVIPRLFFSPEVAQQIARRSGGAEQDSNARFRGLPKDVAQAKDARAKRQSHVNEVSIAKLIKLAAPGKAEVVEGNHDDEIDKRSAYDLLMEHAETVPWFPVDTRRPIEVLRATAVPDIEDGADNRTTCDHLFVSMVEIERLKERAPQGGAAEKRKTMAQPGKKHRRSTREVTPREQVLLAAVACYFNQLSPGSEPPKGTAWAKAVDDKGGLFWKSACPPMSRDEMERLLRLAIVYPDQAEWDGGLVKGTDDGEP